MDTRVDRFRSLFDVSYQAVQAYARRRCPAVDAEDVVAETFATAWRRLDDIPVGAELPWLYGVARRVLANQRRGADRRARLLTRLRAVPAPRETATPGDDAVVLSALAQLRVADQEILRLAAWEELSTAAIAVTLGCTPNAAALRLSRSRSRLRDALTGIEAERTTTVRKVNDA